MKSLENIFKLAKKFEQKLSLAQMLTGEDPKAVVADAFFGPPGSGKDENFFQNFILNPNSKFSLTLPDAISGVNIGATVDTKSGVANFLVSTSPANSKIQATLLNALVQDYTSAYGTAPPIRLSNRVAKGEVKPDIRQTAPTIIQIK